MFMYIYDTLVCGCLVANAAADAASTNFIGGSFSQRVIFHGQDTFVTLTPLFADTGRPQLLLQGQCGYCARVAVNVSIKIRGGEDRFSWEENTCDVFDCKITVINYVFLIEMLL